MCYDTRTHSDVTRIIYNIIIFTVINIVYNIIIVIIVVVVWTSCGLFRDTPSLVAVTAPCRGAEPLYKSQVAG